MTGRRVCDQSGAATVVALALISVLVFVAAVSTGTVAIVLGHRRAQVAADLASLAGASALQSGTDPCAAAAQIAARHDAEITHCVVDGLTVVIATEVRLPAVLGRRPLPARSRAGPQSTDAGSGPATPAARP